MEDLEIYSGEMSLVGTVYLDGDISIRVDDNWNVTEIYLKPDQAKQLIEWLQKAVEKSSESLV